MIGRVARGMKHAVATRIHSMTKTLSRKGLYEFLSREFSVIPTSSKVLTVGAGGRVTELLYKHARDQDFDVLVLDIDKDHEPDMVGDICNFNFRDFEFDVIVMSEVLEHVHSPHEALANIHASLKAGGKLIITTPFMLPIHDRPYDYYRFTRYGLEFLLDNFNDVQINERNSYFETIDVLWVRIWQANTRSARVAGFFIVPLVFFVKAPMSYFLGMIVDNDTMTTGYVVTANK